jgi:hypothetical protein
MTPSEIETAARRQYNAVGSNFWSQAEIFDLIYFAQMDLARRAHVLQQTYETPTVISTADYSYPTNALGIKRITWYGRPLKNNEFKEDDMVTGYDASTVSTGDPRYYLTWNRTISLRPIPSSVQTLKIWTYDQPSVPTAISTLDVPLKYHPDIVDYCLGKMVVKDEKYDLSQYYLDRWEMHIKNAMRDVQKEKRNDSFAYVKDEDAVGLY